MHSFCSRLLLTVHRSASFHCFADLPLAVSPPFRSKDGQFYEAHQQLRVIGARYQKQNQPEQAASLLVSGAELLFSAGQDGSAADLSSFVVEILTAAQRGPDHATRGFVARLAKVFPACPARKKFVDAVVSWATKCSDYPSGDPEVHHLLGAMFAAGM